MRGALDYQNGYDNGLAEGEHRSAEKIRELEARVKELEDRIEKKCSCGKKAGYMQDDIPMCYDCIEKAQKYFEEDK